MNDPVQIISQIRFALEQLSERNAQHEWEHLCRHFARARLCSNILPATGPVQAGGDQGRDFETFHTYLNRQKNLSGTFVGLVSDKPLAFACTLQKTKTLPVKVRNDVNTIMESGSEIEGIYFLCSRGLPVAKQHQLKEWAKEEHSVKLEIIDGAAFSELLCDRELFWICERYLELPAELFPPIQNTESESSWYTITLHKWQQGEDDPISYADFVEIRAAARHAMGEFQYDDGGSPLDGYELAELPFWIEQLDKLCEQEYVPSLQRRARYEASVLRLRGLGSLIGQEAYIEEYFNILVNFVDTASLENSTTLFGYIATANKRDKINLKKSDLNRWEESLESILTDRIQDASILNHINEKCALLETYAYFVFTRCMRVNTICFDEALVYWDQLASIAIDAPLFPLERFSTRLTHYIEFVSNESLDEFLLVIEKVDALVSKRIGQFKVAENSLQRAKLLHESGYLTHGISLLHRVKIDWFAEETLVSAIQAMDWLSLGYQKQGLFFAAKYYALVNAKIVIEADDLRLRTKIGHTLGRVAECDYALGAWHSLFEIVETLGIIYPHYTHDIVADFNNENGFLSHVIRSLSNVSILSLRLFPAMSDYSLQTCAKFMQAIGFEDIFQEILERGFTKWGQLSDSDIEKSLVEQLYGLPWSDAGEQRIIQWNSNGINWIFDWLNDYETNVICEQFIASFQIILADFSDCDLYLLPTTVQATIQLSQHELDSSTECKVFDTIFDPSNTGRKIKICLPAYDQFTNDGLDYQEIQAGIVAIATTLLSDVSFLPIKRFYRILEQKFAQGLSNKLIMYASYGKCYQDFVGRDSFKLSNRRLNRPLTKAVGILFRDNVELPWISSLAQEYTHEKSQIFIHNRYSGFSLSIQFTLKELLSGKDFQPIISRLKMDGWKDWHILSAISHVKMNYFLNAADPQLVSNEASFKEYQAILMQPESASTSIIPMSEFSEVNIRQQIQIYMLSFAKTYDLELHQNTPDFDAIAKFLSARFRFWDDDVEHDNPFI